MKKPLTTLVVARAANAVIGDGGSIPWRISSEMQGFKAYTMGKPIVMGRKTWDSFPKKPLPGRANIIVTRNAAFRPAGAWVYGDLAAALAAARAMAGDEVCVIGGAQIYDAAIAEADRIRLTEIALEPKGDAFFRFDETAWRETAREEHAAGPKDDASFVIRTMDRVR